MEEGFRSQLGRAGKVLRTVIATWLGFGAVFKYSFWDGLCASFRILE